jgi:hypothetical protein
MFRAVDAGNSYVTPRVLGVGVLTYGWRLHTARGQTPDEWSGRITASHAHPIVKSLRPVCDSGEDLTTHGLRSISEQRSRDKVAESK